MRIKVAGAALNQIPLDWAGNQARIESAIRAARDQGATIVTLPELCTTGYGCEDSFFNPHQHDRSAKMLRDLCPATQGLFVSVGLPMIFHGSLFNVTAVLVDGKIRGFVPKKHLPGDGVHYEPRWFKPWPVGLVREIRFGDTELPFGDLMFDVGGVKVGFEICEEAWVAQRPGATLARRGVDVILNPSGSHFAFGKLEVRRSFVTEGSRAYQCGYVYANLLGNEAGRIIFDGGVLIADGGRLIAQGPRLSFHDHVVTAAVIDISRNRVLRARTSSHEPDLEDDGTATIDVAFTLRPDADVETADDARDIPGNAPSPWETSANLKEEEFSRAVALGLFDFLRKSRQQGFVVSLSGGVDSAAVTLLCRLALDLAEQELGLAGLRHSLRYIPWVADVTHPNDFAGRMITTAYQSTVNSSIETLEAARAVAADAGAEFHEWSVDPVLADYEAIATTALRENLTWEKHDASLQNIQARARGPAIWILANVKNALLLATSNRSEAAVGYATMDGDTCGGISPIGGIDKNFLRHWARWMADTGPAGLRAYPSLQKVLAKPPTAELRPLAFHQTDEDDLMPYDLLDRIEKLAIRDKKSPVECYVILKGERPGESRLKLWIARFFRLWCRNQWKRERYAPAFHLDDESLDPKTWCRFPILSSGFEEELRDLEAAP